MSGLTRATDAARGADNADRFTPDPDLCQTVLETREGLSPASIIVVGDTPCDAEAATQAGLTEAGCLALYRDPQDLLDRWRMTVQSK